MTHKERMMPIEFSGGKDKRHFFALYGQSDMQQTSSFHIEKDYSLSVIDQGGAENDAKTKI